MYSPQDLADYVKMHPLTVREYLDDFDIPTPGWEGWSEEEFEEIAQIVNQGARKNPKGISIRVGADPEFEVKRPDGTVSYASTYIRGGLSAQVGTDGASGTGELRPRPGSPERVTSNVRALIKKVKDQLPDNFQIGSGSGTQNPLGGHIHISGRRQSDILVDKLEKFITEPLNAKSGTKDTVRRGYNRPKQWRRQPHGWEYRSPCSWLAHPIITRGALVIAYILSEMTDSELNTLRTKPSLIKRAGDIRGKAIKAFYEFLDSITTLEEIEVFRAWRIADPVLEQSSTLRDSDISRPHIPSGRNPVNINSSNDSHLGPFSFMGLHTHPSLGLVQIVGARNSRSPRENVIFVPRDWSIPDIQSTMNSMSFTFGRDPGFTFRNWDLSTIGISMALRQKIINSNWRDYHRTNRSNTTYSKVKNALQAAIDTDGPAFRQRLGG